MVGGTLADEKALDKSLAQMFKAYRGSSLSSPDLKMLLRSSFDDVNHHDDDVHVQGWDHEHEQEAFHLYHDGPGGHSHDDDGHVHLNQQGRNHEHEQGDFNLYHDGPGGHHHDDDGHVHLYQQGRNHEHEQRDFHLYHDGPGGHDHDDDGHLHHKAQKEDGVSQDKGLKSEEGTKKHDSLSDITLTIAKLLFPLSQAKLVSNPRANSMFG